MEDVAIRIQGLTKYFGKGVRSMIAVDHLNLEIEKGQVYGILGPNGAGKTTTIRMICGMLRPDEGSISIMGQMMNVGQTQKNHKATGAIGICPQELVVWNGMTLMEQLLFMGKMYDVPSHLAKKRASDLLEALHLTEKKNKLAGTLSGGMKRRLNIMLGLMHDPDILILDEPQAGLDPQSRVLIRDYIVGMARHKTVLITTHDMEEADKLCDRVAIIDHGRILVENTPKALKSDMFTGDLIEFEMEQPFEPDMEMLEAWKIQYGHVNMQNNVLQFRSKHPVELTGSLQAQMSEINLAVKDIKIRKASLEDVFIGLTGRGMRE